jgi:hypothetical protein
MITEEEVQDPLASFVSQVFYVNTDYLFDVIIKEKTQVLPASLVSQSFFLDFMKDYENLIGNRKNSLKVLITGVGLGRL